MDVMTDNLRPSGINIIGDVPWGTHFCQFYETKNDLLELIVPYFKAGLENNEFCLWITADPLTVEQATDALRDAIPGFDLYKERKSIEILSYEHWYISTGTFDSRLATEAWIPKVAEARMKGFDGMRVNGNETWLEDTNWSNFLEYEKELNKRLHDQFIIVLCTYPLSTLSARSVLEVARAHKYVLAKRSGNWEMLEEPDIKNIKANLQRINDQLEKKVAERTAELKQVIDELKKEIKERKETEERLITEKELSNQILDSIPALVAIVDENFRYLRWNKNLEEFSGYTAEQLSHLHAVESFISEFTDKVHAYKRAKEMFDKGAFSHEFTREFTDGRTITFRVEGRRIIYLGERCLLILAFDITVLKEIERQVMREKDLSNQILDSIPGIVVMIDQDFRFVRWNKGVEMASGYGPEKLASLHPIEDFFLDEVSKKAAYTIFNEMFEKGIASGEVTPVLDGRKIPFQITGRRVDYEGKHTVLGIGVEIAELKNAEEELRLAYKRLSYLVENTPLAVIEWDKDLFISRWSNQAEKIFGWRSNEALGKNLYDSDLAILYKEDLSAVDMIAYQLTNGLVDRNHSINRNVTKDGKVIYCEWYNSVLRDEQGNVVTILSLTHDITERKEADERLNESFLQIRSLTEHLQNIREQERTRIAREIHDELGQQLTVMKMDVASVNKKLKGINSEIREKINGLISLLDDSMQSVRRIASELRPSILDDLGLNAAIEWQLEVLEKRTGIRFNFKEPEFEWPLPDNVKTNLYRIFQEALTNIVRHANATEVAVKVEQIETQFRLTIQDNGNGFEQTSVDEKKTLGILGIKERTAMMSGTYNISSAAGKGTTLVINIPFSTSINEL